MDDRTISRNHPPLFDREDKRPHTSSEGAAARGSDSSKSADRQIAYWIRKFDGATALQLPVDRPRPLNEPHAVAIDWVRLRIPTALKKRLENTARQRHLSLSAVLFGSWAILLARWCSQKEVVTGARWSRRDASGECIVEGNDCPVPLRLTVDESAPVEQVLREAETVLTEACANTKLSMKDVLSAIQRCNSDEPLLRVFIAFSDVGGCGSIKRNEQDGDSEALSFDLALLLEEVDGHLSGRWEYAKSLFDRDTIRRMAESWNTLLQGVVKHARRPIGQLGLLAGSERDRVVYRNNATASVYPREKLIHELFEEQVGLIPRATALVCQGQVLTYAELNERANRLAHYLRRHGATVRDRVGICLERSADTGVAILGVLKAGAAYVPLDPNHPVERLAYLLDDATPTIVLTQSKLRDCLPQTQTPLIVLDERRDEISREDNRNLTHAKLTAEDLAYVMYTSRSTGQPKGVMVRHRNVVNYATYAVRRFDVEGGEGSLIGTSMSFDLALTGFYPPLICGRAATLCAEDQELSQALLSGRNYSPVKLTPTHLSTLSLPEESVAGRIGTMVVGGELLQGSALRWWREHSPETRIFNHYGPTEATIGCVVHEVCADIEGPVPIGKPIANTQIYILNAYRSPTPVGVVGEIYIGGDAVAAGYWNRPELTAERFVHDPFSGDPNACMYKTGDLGRWRPDGTVEYLGRNKDQVKIRGCQAAVRFSEGAMYE